MGNNHSSHWNFSSYLWNCCFTLEFVSQKRSDWSGLSRIFPVSFITRFTMRCTSITFLISKRPFPSMLHHVCLETKLIMRCGISQWSHLKGFSSVWNFMWTVRFEFLDIEKFHSTHWNGLFPVCLVICTLKFQLIWHSSHWNGLHPLCFLICLLRYCLRDAE